MCNEFHLEDLKTAQLPDDKSFRQGKQPQIHCFIEQTFYQ